MILSLRVVPGLTLALALREQSALFTHPAVAATPHGRGLVIEVNEPARLCGITPGMTLAAARQHCSSVSVLIPDSSRSTAVWEGIISILQSFTPAVEPLERGRAVCDLAGCERLWGSFREAAAKIGGAVRESTGIIPALGLGSSRMIADLAAAYGSPGEVALVPTGSERAFLSSLPLAALPEIDPNTTLTFHVLGITTLGQLAALPASAVRNRFGVLGERLHRYAQGIDPRPVLPPPPRPSIGARRDCDEGTPEEAADLLRSLAAELATELQRRSLAAKLLTLTLHWQPSHPPIRTLSPINPSSASPLTGDGAGSHPTLPVSAHSAHPTPSISHLASPLTDGDGVSGHPAHTALPISHPALPITHRVHSSRLPHPPVRTLTLRSHTPSVLPSPPLAVASLSGAPLTPESTFLRNEPISPTNTFPRNEPNSPSTPHVVVPGFSPSRPPDRPRSLPTKPSPRNEPISPAIPSSHTGSNPVPSPETDPSTLAAHSNSIPSPETGTDVAAPLSGAMPQHQSIPSPRIRPGDESSSHPLGAVPPVHIRSHGSTEAATTERKTALVRTPLHAEAPLLERATALLLNHWKSTPTRRLAAIELEAGEFAQPEQLSFDEVSRIDETGGLAGMSPQRLTALLHGDEAWTARHGATAFRHVAAVDPANVVTERRVRWAEGLPDRRVAAQRRRR